MPSNRAKVDEGLVRKIRYKVHPNRIAKKTPLEALAVA